MSNLASKDLTIRAVALRKAKKPREAIELLREHIDEFATPADRANILIGIGDCQRALHKNLDAIATLTEALELWPDHVFGRVSLAAALCHADRYAEADGHYNHVLERTPKNPYALIGKARCADKLNRAEDARRLYQETLAVDKSPYIREEYNAFLARQASHVAPLQNEPPVAEKRPSSGKAKQADPAPAKSAIAAVSAAATTIVEPTASVRVPHKQIDDLRAFLVQHPRDVGQRYRLATLLFAANDIPAGVEEALAILSIDTNNSGAKNLLRRFRPAPGPSSPAAQLAPPGKPCNSHLATASESDDKQNGPQKADLSTGETSLAAAFIAAQQEKQSQAPEPKSESDPKPVPKPEPVPDLVEVFEYNVRVLVRSLNDVQCLVARNFVMPVDEEPSSSDEICIDLPASGEPGDAPVRITIALPSSFCLSDEACLVFDAPLPPTSVLANPNPVSLPVPREQVIHRRKEREETLTIPTRKGKPAHVVHITRKPIRS